MLIQTRAQFEGVRTALAAADTICFDTETSGLLPHQGDRLGGVATLCQMVGTNYHVSAYFPFRHKPGQDLFNASENLPWEWFDELMQVFRGKRLIAHNWKFDIAMLYYEGYNLSSNPFLCTQVLSWLNCEWESHRLEDLIVKYKIDESAAGYKKDMQEKAKKAGGYLGVSPVEMDPYACRDVENTWSLCGFLLTELDKQELTPLIDREMEFSRLLFEMEVRGIGVDLDLSKSLSDEAAARMRELENAMGFDPLKNVELARRLCLAPPEGLGLIPESYTQTSSPEFPNGLPALRKEWLAKNLSYPLVSNVVEYKSLVKARSTWFDGFREHAGRTLDGRLHTTFNGSSGSKSKSGVAGKSGTVTGRLNSSGPNMQQTPREEETSGETKEQVIQRRVKKLFLPGRQRWSLYEFDYKQIEARLGAAYADATLMLDAFRAGEDAHRVTADRIGCSRQTAKHATYTILYGGGASTLAGTIERLEFQTTGRVIQYDIGDAQQILDAFFELYPGFKEIQQRSAQIIRKRGYVLIWNGRRRHYEKWFDPSLNKWVDNGHKAFNSVIQGGAAEIIKTTMLMLDQKRTTPSKWYPEPMKYDFAWRVVSQVHDSLWVEIVDDNRESYIEDIKYTMEWPGRDARFQIPFEVDVKLLRQEPINEAEWSEREVEFALSSN
jgi:DNA polymerase-1